MRGWRGRRGGGGRVWKPRDVGELDLKSFGIGFSSSCLLCCLLAGSAVLLFYSSGLPGLVPFLFLYIGPAQSSAAPVRKSHAQSTEVSLQFPRPICTRGSREEPVLRTSQLAPLLTFSKYITLQNPPHLVLEEKIYTNTHVYITIYINNYFSYT